MSAPQKEWVLATLNDVQEALENTLTRLEKEPEDHEFADTAMEELTKVYAKLNFAINTMNMGPEAFDVLTDDELVGFPAQLPFIMTNVEEN